MRVRVKSLLIVAAGLCFLSAPPLVHAQTRGPSTAGYGTLIFNTRVRSESVDQQGFASNANALTARVQLGWQSAPVGAFRFLIEGETTYAAIADYNSSVNGKATYPIIADPQSGELNRLQVTWTGLAKTQITAGRQTLVLDNARFIGDVGFRQTEQTFDGVRLSSSAFAPASVTYAYIRHVNRVFGHKSAQGRWNGDVQVLNAASKTPIGALSLYDYLLDFRDAPTQSSATFGGRLTGEHPVGARVMTTYVAEWAQQTNYGRNPGHFALNYTNLSLGLKKGSFAISLNREQLGGNGNFAFQTPLATLHAFQGWADVFLTTPVQGVSDVFVSGAWGRIFNGPVRSVKASFAYHDFRSMRDSLKYGNEWDLGLSTPITNKSKASVQVADFSGNQPSMKSRSKLWLTLDYSY